MSDATARMSEYVHHSEASRLGPPLLPRPSVGSLQSPDISRHQALQPRSCTECCRRKVRCDRRDPCTNCVKGKSDCVFPKSRRAPVRPKRSRGRDEDLLRSLQRLEQRLQSQDEGKSITESVSLNGHNEPGEVEDLDNEEAEAGPRHEVTTKREDPSRLVFDQDRSRYISNNFWASMSELIEEMRDILDGSSSEQEDDEGDDQELMKDTNSSRGLFMFSPSSSLAQQSRYPNSSDLLTMFDVFQENVDPVVRIFHCPTLRTTIAEALPLLDGVLDRNTEVVLFSVCYAALTSLNDEDCRRMFREGQSAMLLRYRHAVEQSLARVRFLDSQNLTVLASLVLFLICVRRHDGSRFVSSLLGVVIRNAQAMGLHRDGTNFKLSPYETEIRRRVWWHICVLDIRASEDHGCDPSIYEMNYDTKFPLNINDEDISPDDDLAPLERSGGSDMIFCLLRFEITIAIRRLNYSGPIGSREPELTPSQKRRMVEGIEKHLHERYINKCDITKPFDWVAATWARLMLAKMWLAASNPLQSQEKVSDENNEGQTPSKPLDLRSLAFKKSVEVLELSDLLETGHRAARWRWLFLTHVQWHAVVFVLAHLCVHPSDELASRAWIEVERLCERWYADKSSKRGMLWKPIRRLMDRARQARASGQSSPPDPRFNSQFADKSPRASSPRPAPASQEMPDQLADPLLHGMPSSDINSINGSIPPFTPSQNDVALSQYMNGASDTDMVHSDWNDILQELQLGLQEDQIITDPTSSIENYGRGFWNTL